MVSNLQEQMKAQKMNINERMSKIGKKIAIGSGKGELENPLLHLLLPHILQNKENCRNTGSGYYWS